jgi:hypothetical protein
MYSYSRSEQLEQQTGQAPPPGGLSQERSSYQQSLPTVDERGLQGGKPDRQSMGGVAAEQPRQRQHWRRLQPEQPSPELVAIALGARCLTPQMCLPTLHCLLQLA